jgi:polyisoprenoid-binding protein YceI
MFRKTLLAAASIAMISAPVFAADSDEWTIDSAHSAANFSIKHMMISNVTGTFGKVTGTVNYDGTHLDKAKIDSTINVASISTREEKRDQHLKSPDFFDVEKYPTMTFKSTSIEPGKDGFKIHGDLTIHGVTKPVVLNAEPLSPAVKSHGSLHMGTSATTKINRKDYGLSFNKTIDNGGAMVGDDVNITIDIELKQAEAKTEAPPPKSEKS